MENLDIEKEITIYQEKAKVGKVVEAVESLLNIEKKYRLAEDVIGTKKCCLAILKICYDAGDWKLLNEQIIALSKRRGQLKNAIQAFVRYGMSLVELTPDHETKVALIKTLQAVTEGKIFVEIERARLTKKLAKIIESEGKIAEAADTLQEVAVETFGAMAKTEKIAFILEQVRLCMDKGDYIRAQILSRKISPRAFVEKRGEASGEIGIEGTAVEEPEEDVPKLQELKLMYYMILIRYHLHFNNYLEICRSYRAMYESHDIVNDSSKWQPILKKICWFIILSPQFSTDKNASSDQITLLQTTYQDKNLGEIPLFKNLLKTFITKELIYWENFKDVYQSAINEEHDIFGSDDGQHRINDLWSRVIEHNMLVLSSYYTRMTMKRLSEFLDLDIIEAEKRLSDMVVHKAIYAKIDRPAGIIVFGGSQAPDSILNEWSTNTSKLLELVEKSCQQIQKESMQYKIPIGFT